MELLTEPQLVELRGVITREIARMERGLEVAGWCRPTSGWRSSASSSRSVAHSMRRAAPVLAVTALVLAGLACKGSAGRTSAAAGARAHAACRGDTVRGTVSIVGSEPATTIVIESLEHPPRIVALDGDRVTLARLQGLEAVVAGRRLSPTLISVEEFAVRRSGRVRAVDGTLMERDGRPFLDVGDGSPQPIGNLPQTLRDAFGTRIWLAGEFHRDPDSYGRIGAPATGRTCPPTRDL